MITFRMSWQETRDRVKGLCREPALRVNRNMAFGLIEKLKDRVQAPTSVRLEQDECDSRPYLTMRWGDGMDRYTVMVMITVDGWGVFHRLKCTNVDRDFVYEVANVLESKIRAR